MQIICQWVNNPVLLTKLRCLKVVAYYTPQYLSNLHPLHKKVQSYFRPDPK